jgi:aminoglycoside phosphotransferase (APT) family kinase protein
MAAARTPPSADVIPVREDETVDEAKVAAYLEGKLPKTGPELQVWQFPGGHANLTYLLHYPGVAEYVLRRGPHGYIAASAHDMGREYRVLSVLWRAYPPAPRAFLYCEDKSIVGAPFFVMERRLGTVVAAGRPAGVRGRRGPRRQPEALRGGRRYARRLPRRRRGRGGPRGARQAGRLPAAAGERMDAALGEGQDARDARAPR